jgi:ABC-type nitrate/sulfonate/bicarbonate transport system substrate-binding protein
MPRLAAEAGAYARAGLEPKFTLLDSAALATAALVSGSVAAVQAGPGELIAAQAQGHEAVAVATAYAGFAQSTILSNAAAAKVGVPPSAPIAERLKALGGLAIASASATSGATVALRLAAEKMAGVTIRWVYIAQSSYAAAMQRGAIDGFIGSAPYSTLAVAKGLGVLWVNGPGGDLPRAYAPANAGLVLMMRPYAESHHDFARRLVASFADFAQLVQREPGTVKAMIARLYPDLDPKTLDLFYATEGRAWTGGVPTVADMQHELDFVRGSGLPIPNSDRLDPAAMIFAA